MGELSSHWYLELNDQSRGSRGIEVPEADRIKHRVADQAEAKSAFNTPQAGNNPSHHIVELPKPVTEKVAQKFNEVYK